MAILRHQNNRIYLSQVIAHEIKELALSKSKDAEIEVEVKIGYTRCIVNSYTTVSLPLIEVSRVVSRIINPFDVVYKEKPYSMYKKEN